MSNKLQIFYIFESFVLKYIKRSPKFPIWFNAELRRLRIRKSNEHKKYKNNSSITKVTKRQPLGLTGAIESSKTYFVSHLAERKKI